MFDEFYTYRFIQKLKPPTEGTYIWEHKYTFTCDNNHRYIVNVEEYSYEVFAVKFHLKAHTDSPNKYRLTVGRNYAPKIISTVIEIMLLIYRENPKASFGFLGSPLLNEPKGRLTKRARIYNFAINQLFPPGLFMHYTYAKYSAYLLVNGSIFSNELVKNIENMFSEMYNFEELLHE